MKGQGWLCLDLYFISLGYEILAESIDCHLMESSFCVSWFLEGYILTREYSPY